jgi:CheY-like chemotaxis protein
LAEDNDINREVATEMLSSLGYKFRWVSNGRQAFEVWLNGQVDLILMDCQMPEMDGYEATQAIRIEEGRRADRRRIPIVALTAHATKGDRDRCLEAGMDDYLTKPLGPQALGSMLDRWIRRQPDVGEGATMVKDSGPVDYPALLRRCMNKPELASRLVRKLVEQADQDVTAIAAALLRNDAAALAASAHRLKGASANVSAAGLRQAAGELEQLGRSGNLAPAGALLEQLQAELVRLKRLPESFFNPGNFVRTTESNS